jgi:hypothetical protein
VHFSTVLLLSALTRIPWQGSAAMAVLFGLIGLAGIAYALLVARRMRIQQAYAPELEDWLFHVVLPIAAYAILATSAPMAASHLREALLGVGVAVLFLLFIGIHNAWDAVSYHVFVQMRKARD